MPKLFAPSLALLSFGVLFLLAVFTTQCSLPAWYTAKASISLPASSLSTSWTYAVSLGQ